MAQQRLKIINFYKKYGEKATKEAFGANRKVISRWCPRLKGRGCKIQALVPISTKPDKFRTSPNKLQNNSKNKGIKATTLQIREI